MTMVTRTAATPSRRAEPQVAARRFASRPRLKSRALLRAITVWMMRLGVASNDSTPHTTNVSAKTSGSSERDSSTWNPAVPIPPTTTNGTSVRLSRRTSIVPRDMRRATRRERIMGKRRAGAALVQAA